MSEEKKILVIDDDEDVIAIVETILTKNGFVVKTAMDGKSGMEAARAEKPDLILLDIIMEDVDAGFTVAEALGREFPIFLLSSIADSSAKVFDVHELPIKGVLQKPIKADVLLEKINKTLNG